MVVADSHQLQERRRTIAWSFTHSEQEWMTTSEIALKVQPSLAREALVRDKALLPGRIHH